MSDLIPIARPYAKAAFEYALAQSQLSEWPTFLDNAGECLSQQAVRDLLQMPQVDKSQVVKMVVEVSGGKENSHMNNFLRLLQTNHRLPVLPEIATLFKQLVKNYHKTVDVQFTTAFALGESQRTKLLKALNIRLQREIRLQESIDTTLLGGAVIRAGDLVIDGSVRSQLERLQIALEA